MNPPYPTALLPRKQFHDLTLVIENLAGQVRRGPGWINKVPVDYGFIAGTVGADGDEMDCYLGPNPESTLIFVVDQNNMNGSGSFDEHKCMLGYKSMLEAKRDYLRGHSYGYAIFRSITALGLGAFKSWLKYGDVDRPMSRIVSPMTRRPKNHRFTTRKLSPDQVALIRHTSGKSKQQWASELGVGYDAIHKVMSHKTFQDEAV